MASWIRPQWWLIVALPTLSGCGIGFSQALFMTKSNVGVDIDTKPPTAEISIARKELAIAPAFEGGQTPPVLAGFSDHNRLLFGFGTSSVFAGGSAARILSQPYSGGEHDGRLCLDSAEAPKGVFRLFGLPLKEYRLPAAGEIHPFVFGTDTSLGVKIAWSGMTAQFPDTVRVGFHRKEMALAPVFGQATREPGCTFSVEMPSFIATINVDLEASEPTKTYLDYQQSFATGSAAVGLANNTDTKRQLLKHVDAASVTVAYGNSATGACIGAWLDEGDEAQQQTRVNTLNQWWVAKGHPAKSWPALISGQEFESDRLGFIGAQGIVCPQGGA